jgi:hypothetical protein
VRNHAQYSREDVAGAQSKHGQFPTTGVSAFMDNTCTRVTAVLCIEMRALPELIVISSHSTTYYRTSQYIFIDVHQRLLRQSIILPLYTDTTTVVYKE